MPKSGDAQKNRAARAQGARDNDKAGSDARKELAKLKNAKGLTPFGQRNKFLCEARKAQRTGDKTKTDKFMAEAAALAPLTSKEKLNVERAR